MTPDPFPPDPDELRTVALAAEVYLRIDSAAKYGFITGGPEIDVDRCEECLAFARERGITYTEDDIDAMTVAILGEELSRG